MNLNELKAKEEEVEGLIYQLKKEMAKYVEKKYTQKRHIKKLPNGGSCAVVSIQEIMSTPGHILSPRYYLASQVDAINAELGKCSSLAELCQTVQRLVYTGKTIYYGEALLLNDAMLDVLKRSELGQYTISQAAEIAGNA